MSPKRIVIALIFAAIALVMTKHISSSDECDSGNCRPRKMLCLKSLNEQLKDKNLPANVSVTRVRAESSGDYAVKPDERYNCVHKVDVIQKVSGTWSPPNNFMIAEDNPLSKVLNCKPTGSQFFVIMIKAALKEELKTCVTSSVIDTNEEGNLLEILNSTK